MSLLSSVLRTPFRTTFFNAFPCYRGTGGRVQSISKDWRHIVVQIPLSLGTRNYVGTIFGGSIYGAIDPFYMIMLMQNLGPGYVVWDKSAVIRFKKPGTSKLTAKLSINEAELKEIRKLCKTVRSIDRTYLIELKNDAGVVCAEVEKVIYIREKEEK
jgi:acyl-coenzyme A thioesterase PaaI-like protein